MMIAKLILYILFLYRRRLFNVLKIMNMDTIKDSTEVLLKETLKLNDNIFKKYIISLELFFLILIFKNI